jgi:hypothetical protein
MVGSPDAPAVAATGVIVKPIQASLDVRETIVTMNLTVTSPPA